MSSKKRTTVSTKYVADALDEFQPGSSRKVLKNLLGITSVREMQKEESKAYREAERIIISTFRMDQRLRISDVHSIHRDFLGKIYAWAGTPRSVNITKGEFTFASAYALPSALALFEREILAVNTSCTATTIEEAALKIAAVHAEFLLLHPYREGNGRTGRLIATLMAYQAGLPGIDFSFIGSKGKELEMYIGAVQAALTQNYEPMRGIILRALRLALRRAGSVS